MVVDKNYGKSNAAKLNRFQNPNTYSNFQNLNTHSISNTRDKFLRTPDTYNINQSWYDVYN